MYQNVPTQVATIAVEAFNKTSTFWRQCDSTSPDLGSSLTTETSLARLRRFNRLLQDLRLTQKNLPSKRRRGFMVGCAGQNLWPVNIVVDSITTSHKIGGNQLIASPERCDFSLTRKSGQ